MLKRAILSFAPPSRAKKQARRILILRSLEFLLYHLDRVTVFTHSFGLLLLSQELNQDVPMAGLGVAPAPQLLPAELLQVGHKVLVGP
jgi:hypothetical protein